MFKREKMYQYNVHLQPQLLSLPTPLRYAKIWSAQDVKGLGHYSKVKSQIKVIP